MKKTLLFSLLVFIALSGAACGTGTAYQPTSTPTEDMGVTDAVYKLMQQEMIGKLTQQAEDRRATSTQAVIAATATRAAYEIHAAETQRADTATQRAFNVTVAAAKAADAATAQAQAAATQAYFSGVTATTEWKATATQNAFVAQTAAAQVRETATADYKTQQAPIEAARLRALNAQADAAELALVRQKATNDFQAWGPWVLAAVCGGMLIFVVIKKSEVGVIKDGRGNTEAVKVGNRLVNPSLMIRPVLEFNRDGVTAPELGVPMDAQSQHAHDRNIVAGISAMPQGLLNQAVKYLQELTAPRAPGVQIQVLQPGQMGSLRADLEEQLAQEVVDG